MLTKIYVDHFLTHPGGDIEVGFHYDNEPIASHSVVYPSREAMISDGATLLADPASGGRIAVAAWLGVDPTGSDESLATQFRTEIDMSALVMIRRVLDV